MKGDGSQKRVNRTDGQDMDKQGLGGPYLRDLWFRGEVTQGRPKLQGQMVRLPTPRGREEHCVTPVQAQKQWLQILGELRPSLSVSFQKCKLPIRHYRLTA